MTAAADLPPRGAGHRAGSGPIALATALVAVGVIARIAPLLDAAGRLFRQFPTEDGYLMLTIARNIALGKGMSVSDGTQPTNGTQPLATLLWAVEFWFAGGDRRLGVLAILLTQLIFAAVAAYLLYRLACRVMEGQPRGAAVSLILSAAWFASPLVVAHSMNCLETGLYALATLAVALAFVDASAAEPWGALRCLGVGLVLGLAFWVRNDAVFLVLAACAIHVGWGVYDPRKPLGRRIGETLLFGATSLATASPWLAFNWLRFGGIVPVSGQSEALDAHFAENLWSAPIAVFEYATLFLPIPNQLEATRFAIGLGLLACALVGVLVVRVGRGNLAARVITALGAMFGALLLSFYGLSFGAGYFFSRYTFPLSPFLALLWGTILGRGWEVASSRGWQSLPIIASLVLVALALGLDARLYRNGSSHMHFQVVEWVRDNVPEEVWVAAPQSGTLGFFHARTINLDGKVNPAALAVRRADGAVTRYVLEQPEIEYLADWEGIASWATQPRIASEFELVVDDPQRNLAVLRRRDRAGSG
jgi:hypothetical protein